MEHFMKTFHRFADFEGRSSREEFLWFQGINMVLGLMWLSMAAVVGVDVAMLIGMPLLLYWMVALIPAIALHVRRLHDVGWSGWVVLLGLLPFGGLVVFLACCQAGQPHENQYGRIP